MLVKYLDADGQNDEKCEPKLNLIPWLPNFAHWSEHFNLSKPVFLHLNQSFSGNSASLYWPDNVALVSNIPLVVFPSSPRKIVDFPSGLQRLFDSDQSRRAIANLYDQGADFLYGMLFARTFQFEEAVQGNTQIGVNAPPLLARTIIAINSVHREPNNDGSDISSEIKCLESYLLVHSKTRETPAPCHVYLISDRNETLTKLQSWLKSYNCTAWSTLNTLKSESTWKRESQSPTLNFFENLRFVSNARFRFIGHVDPSSDLLVESIEYQRRMEVWKQGRDPPLLPTLNKCTLEENVSEFQDVELIGFSEISGHSM